MFTAFLGQFKSVMRDTGDEEEPQTKKTSGQKSASSEEFLKTPEAKEFIANWMEKNKDGEPLYKRRGLTDFLSTIFQVPGLDTNRKVLAAADKILLKLGGMDGLEAFLGKLKAKPEALLKGIKSILGK